jgi:hypothetical protein
MRKKVEMRIASCEGCGAVFVSHLAIRTFDTEPSKR